MKIIRSLLFVSLIFSLVGCANQFAVMRDANRQAMNKVELGMSKNKVETVMGNRSAEDMFEGRYENPYKRETVKGVDGNTYDVMYYYTQQIGNKPIESGLTPVVFLGEKVVGIGWGYLDGVSGNSTSTIRRR
jgi:hypothetical protein